MNKRVQIPVYLDAWMRGDRYGEVLKISKYKPRAKNGAEDPYRWIATVKLDKSGGVIRVMYGDCVEVA